MPRAAQFKIRGIGPEDLADYPRDVRQQFWQWVADLAIQRKVQELTAGLDKDGEPLRPISAATRKHRRSAMTPTGKGDPNAPPLIPAWHKSRTISLFATRAFPDHVDCFWRYDAFTGDSWGVVLEYQKRHGRDVIGISPAGLDWIRRTATARWEQWKRRAPRPEVATARTNPRVTRPRVERGTAADLEHATLGIGASAPEELLNAEFFAKPRTRAEWRKYFTASQQAAIPGRPSPRKAPHPTTGPSHNRLLAHLWGTRRGPDSPRIAVAPTPVAPTRPVPAGLIDRTRRRGAYQELEALKP